MHFDLMLSFDLSPCASSNNNNNYRGSRSQMEDELGWNEKVRSVTSEGNGEDTESS